MSATTPEPTNQEDKAPSLERHQAPTYRGRLLTDLTRDELIQCAIEGWTMYTKHLESSINALRTINALREAARR